MIKKSLITTVALGLTIGAVQVMPGAQEPLYDQDGNLILDLPQEPYKDLSTPDNQQENTQTKEGGKVANVQEEFNRVSETQTFNVEGNQETQSTQPTQSTQNTESNQNNQSTQNTQNIPSSADNVISPESGTYLFGSQDTLIVKANKIIKSVTVNNSELSSKSWSFQNNVLTFKSSELDDTPSGQYSVTLTFADNTTSVYSLKVVGESFSEDYWKQNISSFNKDIRASSHKDLELSSSNENPDVKTIQFDRVDLPATAYKVIKNTVIISKDYLKTIPENDRIDVVVNYGKGKSYYFTLEIIDAVEKPNTSENVDC